MAFFIYLAIITLFCLIPFVIAVSYFVVGLKNYLTGKKEKSRVKIIGGSNAAILSFLGMLIIFFVWCWFCRIFLNWEL
ncbi:MAG: hypothetical protein ABIR30_10200 [Chitinophagaceae bacterium]